MTEDRFAVEWELASGRGSVNRYDRTGLGLPLESAKEYLRRVLARAQHVTGSRFVGKIVLLKPAHARPRESRP